MGRFTLQLPGTLHKELEILAEGEDISLDQYIIYALTQKVTAEKLAFSDGSLTPDSAILWANIRLIPLEQVVKQQEAFEQLLDRLGKPATDEEVERYLAERETVEPEPELNAEAVQQFQSRIKQHG